jgi:hypothetical protein
MNTPTIPELKDLYSRLLGAPPTDDQFELWCTLHTPETVKHGIVKTSQKNLSTGRLMTTEHKLRFASAVMNSSTAQKMAGQRGAQ